MKEQYWQRFGNPELYRTDNNAALASAAHEVFLTLSRLFGHDERTAKFFRIPIPPKGYEFSGNVTRTSDITICQFLDTFVTAGGVDALIQGITD